jgi:hypothetical protein
VTRTDTATLKATTAIVSVVALFAAGDSFTHVYDLARQHNQPVVSAALLALAGDGLVAAASAAMLAAVRSGRPVPVRARILLVLGIGATVWAAGAAAATGAGAAAGAHAGSLRPRPGTMLEFPVPGR